MYAKLPDNSRPQVPPFTAGVSRIVWTWGHLAAEVGMSKLGGGSGLHNKPAGCSASEVYASGPDGGEEEERGRVLSRL